MRRRRKNFGVEGKTGRVSSHSFAAAVLVQAQHTQAILPMKEDHMKKGQLRRKKFQTPESAKQAFRPEKGRKAPECQKSGGAGGTASCRGYRGGAPNPCAAALSPQTSVALFAGNSGQLGVFRQAEAFRPEKGRKARLLDSIVSPFPARSG